MADPRIARIEHLLQATGKSNRWLAEQVGSTDTTVGHILDGTTKNPRDRSIVERMLIALEGVPYESDTVKLFPRVMRSIPIASRVMAGPPSMNIPDIEFEDIPDWGAFFDRWGRIIEGESMLPTLRPGDIAIFENRRIENGSVVHAFRDGEDCVKAFRQIGDNPTLDSFNPDGPSFPADGWDAKGVCVARIRYREFKIREYTEFPTGLSWAMRTMD